MIFLTFSDYGDIPYLVSVYVLLVVGLDPYVSWFHSWFIYIIDCRKHRMFWYFFVWTSFFLGPCLVWWCPSLPRGHGGEISIAQLQFTEVRDVTGMSPKTGAFVYFWRNSRIDIYTLVFSKEVQDWHDFLACSLFCIWHIWLQNSCLERWQFCGWYSLYPHACCLTRIDGIIPPL